MSVSPSVCLSISVCLTPSVYLRLSHSVCLPPFVFLRLSLSVCFSPSVSIRLSFSDCLSVCLYVCVVTYVRCSAFSVSAFCLGIRVKLYPSLRSLHGFIFWDLSIASSFSLSVSLHLHLLLCLSLALCLLHCESLLCFCEFPYPL